MKQIQTKINQNSNGMHARPASMFVKVAAKFPCDIYVVKDEVEVNGKSIMGLMMLAMGPGTEFTIRAEGEQEEEALEALAGLVRDNFNEGNSNPH